MVTLDRLVNVLGGSGARLCCCPQSREVTLGSVVVHDPTDARVATGDVFLAVGVESPTEAVRLAGRTRAVAVLVRGTAPLDEGAASAAHECGVAVVLVDPAVSWSQLSGLVYGLVLEGRETESGRGPTDLFALADTLAAAVDGAVVIEDQLSRVLAYSNLQHGADRVRLETILGRRLPDTVRRVFAERGVFAHLAASDEPLFVEPSPRHGLQGRMVVAVRAGRELLGSLWVESGTPLTGHRRTVLEDGARTAALHLLRSRASADLERQVESDLVIRLLEGTAEALAMIGQLGLPQGNFRVIALQAHMGDERHAGVLLAFDRATTGFGWSRQGRSAMFGHTVYTLWPCGHDDLVRARSWIDTVVAELSGQVTVSAGIGGPAGAAALPASRQEADECLALHAARPGTAAVVYDESWDEILLQRLRVAASSGRAPTRGPIVELRRHDAEHATRYIETLRAWLQAQGDVAEAASRLQVHPNTVRYRLRKMAEATNLELDRPDKRLAMIIALAATDEAAY